MQSDLNSNHLSFTTAPRVIWALLGDKGKN
jgi:hypothetical protein